MAGSTVFAPRYAHAFAHVVAEKGLDVAAAQTQLQGFASLLAENHDLREILMNPSIPAEQKLSVVDALAERMGMLREVRNFLAVIMEHERLGGLSEILAAYDQVADAGNGVTEAEITSAFDLNEDDRKELEAQVAKLAGGKVTVIYKQDKALLGGAVVRIGSTIYDGSVKAQLERMKQSLVSA